MFDVLDYWGQYFLIYLHAQDESHLNRCRVVTVLFFHSLVTDMKVSRYQVNSPCVFWCVRDNKLAVVVPVL